MASFTDDITLLIPQRPPFVMIDRLTAYDEKVTVSSFLVTKDNIFLDNNQFTEPGLVENIAQTAAARAGYISLLESKPVQLGYIGAVKDLVIYGLPFTGDELLTEITVENQIFDVTLINGKVRCNGAIMATCEMKIFISSSNKL